MLEHKERPEMFLDSQRLKTGYMFSWTEVEALTCITEGRNGGSGESIRLIYE